MSSVKLPEPSTKGEMSVEEASRRRRSRRHFTDAPVTLEQLGQLLWSAQGTTEPGGRRRAAPSAGATYPMEIFVAVGPKTVGALEAAVYRYVPARHELEEVLEGDLRAQIGEAALGQDFLASAPADILVAADYGRTSSRYGERAERYVHMEAGHVGQNVHLQAEALGLGTVVVGAFNDDALARVLELPSHLAPLYLMPIGHPE